ncbi:MAG: M28 family peptidase [Candidatus Lokiarchaeota archaeon]|nr:M28 family peptidase [Candidatus Lokiarchaeota archaeon]
MNKKLEVYDDLTKEAFTYINHVCDRYGPRISGTIEEQEALEELEKKMRSFADFTYFDSFKVYPTFYPRGFVTIFGIFVIFGAVFFLFKDSWCFLSLLLPLFALFILFISLVKMKYWFALFSKKGVSHNAIARILPCVDQEIRTSKKKVMIVGHMDSAFQMKITRFGDKSMLFFAVSIIYTVLIMFLTVIKLILIQFNMQYLFSYWIFGISWIDIVFILITIFLFPILIITLHGFSGGIPVLGANDNLSGVALALIIGKYFTQSENRLHNIELWVGAFGSEECGERGSQYFIEKYGAMGLLDKNSIAVIPESIGAGTDLAILTKEMMHLASHNLEICGKIERAYHSLIKEVGQEAVVSCRIAPELKMGASDGGRFALAGYDSSTLLGYEGSIMKPANWHDLTDDPQHLSHKTFRTAIAIYIHFIRNLDEELERERSSIQQDA